jgi:Rod binding domain-containing protein
MSGSLTVDPMLAVKAAQDMDMVQRKIQVDALRSQLTAPQDSKAKLRETCEGFEAIFIQKMWEEMRNNVPKEGYLHSKDEQMYQSMFDHEFAKKMSSAGGIGLADMLYDQLAQTLGDSSRTSSPGVNPRLPVIPASSSPSNLRFAEQDRKDAQNVAQMPGSEAAKNNIKPLYEEYVEPFEPVSSAAAVTTDGAVLTDELDFEAISQSLLHEEIRGQSQTQEQRHSSSGGTSVGTSGGTSGGTSMGTSWGMAQKVHAPGRSISASTMSAGRVNKKI